MDSFDLFLLLFIIFLKTIGHAHNIPNVFNMLKYSLSFGIYTFFLNPLIIFYFYLFSVPMTKDTLSDSETDSDVLFENRHGKSNGVKRNGFNKPERRVKT